MRHDRIKTKFKCPHCGWTFGYQDALVREHKFQEKRCPGVGQVPRNALSDMRPLWKDLPPAKPAESGGAA